MTELRKRPPIDREDACQNWCKYVGNLEEQESCQDCLARPKRLYQNHLEQLHNHPRQPLPSWQGA